MVGKKKHTFTDISQVVETYFPTYAAARRNRGAENNPGQVGLDLAAQLARKFERSLRQKTTARSSVPCRS